MNICKSFWLIAVLLLAVFSTTVFAQSPDATTSLQYPFKKSDMPGEEESTLPAWESVKRTSTSGWLFTEYATGYPAPVTWVYHPGWDMSVVGTSHSDDVGTKLRAVADGIVVSPSEFDEGKSYKIPTDWNELLIRHNVGGRYPII